ncbi:ferredoxin--NADP reductase [Ochrobactrum sp. BTU1]|jgi:ferredoxin--NADP+ reductase|uniref:ferredoxin--NADP reductase n=1 Tax=Ochrobactrum sp. BTU1 TaxID=2840456 RepID=UPI001C03EED1|nr:ferredoxin--NADP reductase [Ochrobactrum sp. BTU1]
MSKNMSFQTAPLDIASSSFPIPSGVLVETVLSVTHYTNRLFSFTTTREPTFRFRSGEFAMIGLPNSTKPIFRAYSIASPAWEEKLEFFSIKVEDGPLTQHLQKLSAGDSLLIRPKTTGTLVLDALLPGRRLWMLSTGTGIAPFASVIQDPQTYETFDQVILVQCCRMAAELDYGFDLMARMKSNPAIREFTEGHFSFYPTVTQDEFRRQGRITQKIADGSLFDDLNLPQFCKEQDRIMICGSIAMTRDLKTIVESLGFEEGSNNAPAHFVIERAFVS